MKMKLAIASLLVAVAFLFGSVIAQEDPWHRPLSTHGNSAGVTYGTQFPSATNQSIPGDGELMVQTVRNATDDPGLYLYSILQQGWMPQGPTHSLTTAYWTMPPRFSHTEDAVNDFTGGNNVPYVYRVYIDSAITVASASVLLVDGGAIAAGDILGIAIYTDADGGAQLTTGTGDGTAAGLETVDVTDVTLYPGFYRLLVCSSDATNLHLHATLQDDETIDIISAVAGDITFGTAANVCVVGVPPATTGAITTADENIPVVMLH